MPPSGCSLAMLGCCRGLGRLSPKRRRGDEPRSPLYSLRSPWPGAVGRGGDEERRRDQGLREQPFDGFGGLREGIGEPGGLNTKERLRKRGAGQGMGPVPAEKALWVLVAVPEECRECVCARHSPGLGRPRKRLSEPQRPFPYPGPKAPRSLLPWHCLKGTEGPHLPQAWFSRCLGAIHPACPAATS